MDMLYIHSEFCLIGLGLICVGAGANSCVIALGGDQFKMPEHAHPLQTFFRACYLATNVGALISIFLGPVLR